MPVFDFFREFTGVATYRPWRLFASTASPSLDCSSKSTTSPVIHDLHFTFVTCPPRAHRAPPLLVPSPVQMPLEIILAIIEAACPPDAPDIALLKACSLVCRTWSVPVQKLLFKNVQLRTAKAFDSFNAAVGPDSQHARVLRDAVRHLRVVMDHCQPSYLHQHAFARAVAMCPNLQELDLALYGLAEPGVVEAPGSIEASRLRRRAPPFDAQTMSILRSGPHIKSLSFSNWSENQQCIFQLLEIWPGLESLSMSGTSPHLTESTSFPHRLPPCFPGALKELRINFQTAPSLEFMGWLLHQSASSRSLRSLTFERDPCPDLFEFMMDSFSQDLQCLSIPNCTSLEHARSIDNCSNLRFLRMDRPQPNPLAYKSVPAAIRHLALGVDRDTPLQPVIDVVRGRKDLQVVTVRLWNGGECHRLLPALRIACAYRGVELRTTHDSLEYRSLTKC